MTGAPLDLAPNLAPNLAEGFPPADAERWRALVDKALAGKPFKTLRARLHDGLTIEPVYTKADAPQGRVIGRAGPWDIRQVVAQEDSAKANADALADLEGGATSIELCLRNEKMETPEFFATALEGVMLDLAPVAIEPYGVKSAEGLAAFAAKRGMKQAAFAFNMSPLWDGAADVVRDLASDFPNATLFRVDARWVHEEGGSEAQELASALSQGVSFLRAAEPLGLTPQDVAQRTLFAFSTGTDLIVEIAKLRAARLVWANVLRACGADAPMKIQAFSGLRMMTTRDAWTNMLRVTAAAFAAAVGGAAIITTAPMTEAMGMPTPFARRIARNTQILIQEEAHIAKVRDPGAGSWAIEKLTDDLARAAWAEFQNASKLNDSIDAVRAKRVADIRKRNQQIIGVSEHPLLGATEPAVDTPFPAWIRSHMTDKRLSAPFEDLRATGKDEPKIFLATLGAPATFSAREGFARGLFEAGGIKAVGGEVDHSADIGDAFKKSGAVAACLCGADTTYAQSAEAAAHALKQAGCTFIALAGKPGENEAALRAAGIDAFAFAGDDAVTFLKKAHAALGLWP
jgi:methylmalonyl-CoA mutase